MSCGVRTAGRRRRNWTRNSPATPSPLLTGDGEGNPRRHTRRRWTNFAKRIASSIIGRVEWGLDYQQLAAALGKPSAACGTHGGKQSPLQARRRDEGARSK